MRDQIQLPEENSTVKYIQLYINLSGEIIPFLAVGKNPMQTYNKILDEILHELEIPHLHVIPTVPAPLGSRYRPVMQGECTLKDNVWTFNESRGRIELKNPRIECHFKYMEEMFPELEFKVNTMYDQMV